MKLTLDKAAAFIKTYIKARVAVNLIGSPGIGKSDIIKQVADALNLKVIDFRLSTCDPTDLTGLPFIENGRSVYLPNVAFPLEGDELPINPDTGLAYDGWLLFLDEISNAPMSVQAASYKLILDREVGLHKLHPKVEIVSAGNSVNDNAAVQAEMGTALKSRMAHINIEQDLGVWLDWALANNVHHSITSFLKFDPKSFYKFDPNADADTFPCPRTWGMVNSVVQTVGFQHPDINQLLAGVISDGYASEYYMFCKHFANLPTYEDIIKDPLNTPMPDNGSVMYALSGSIGAQTKADSIDKVLDFVKRMPAEFQLRTFNDITTRNPMFVGLPAAKAWLNANAKKMTT